MTTATTAPDPFDPTQNPLGTKGLRAAYLDASNCVMLGQDYASLIQNQQTLNVSGIDAGLALKVRIFQGQLRNLAGVFLGTLSSGFIQTVTDTDNLNELMGAFAEQLPSEDLKGWFSNAKTREDVTDLVEAIAELQGEIDVKMGALADQTAEVQTGVAKVKNNLDKSVSSAITILGSTVEATSETIDQLREAIDKNITDIVSGAEETGGAVRELLLGLLTTIKGQADDPPGGKDDEGKDDDSNGDSDESGGGEAGDGHARFIPLGEEGGSGGDALRTGVGPGGSRSTLAMTAAAGTPDVQFVVTAVSAGSAGVAKWSEAQKALQRNNEQLAAAYQSLASQNALLAVAKVVETQTELFAGAVTDFAESVSSLQTNWKAVRKGSEEFQTSVGAVSSQEDARKLEKLASAAETLWSNLGIQLKRIQKSLTANKGGLSAI